MSLLIVSTPYPECAQTYIAVSIHVYMRHKVCACVCLLINTNTHMYLTNYVRMSHELCVLCICCCSSKQTHKYSIYIVSVAIYVHHTRTVCACMCMLINQNARHVRRDLFWWATNCVCLRVHADQHKRILKDRVIYNVCIWATTYLSHDSCTCEPRTMYMRHEPRTVFVSDQHQHVNKHRVIHDLTHAGTHSSWLTYIVCDSNGVHFCWSTRTHDPTLCDPRSMDVTHEHFGPTCAYLSTHTHKCTACEFRTIHDSMDSYTYELWLWATNYIYEPRLTYMWVTNYVYEP